MADETRYLNHAHTCLRSVPDTPLQIPFLCRCIFIYSVTENTVDTFLVSMKYVDIYSLFLWIPMRQWSDWHILHRKVRLNRTLHIPMSLHYQMTDPRSLQQSSLNVLRLTLFFPQHFFLRVVVPIKKEKHVANSGCFYKYYGFSIYNTWLFSWVYVIDALHFVADKRKISLEAIYHPCAYSQSIWLQMIVDTMFTRPPVLSIPISECKLLLVILKLFSCNMPSICRWTRYVVSVSQVYTSIVQKHLW